MNERTSIEMSQEIPPKVPSTDLDVDRYLDRPFDLVARVQAAKDAAQREMETFGHVSEYEIRKIYGQKSQLSYGPSEDEHTAESLNARTQRPSIQPQRKNDVGPEQQSQTKFDFDAADTNPPQSPAKDT
jgi:hypothetical protein